ncbi:hypothetical protein Scep_027428 [Stephania cephalantha]|uniref:Uncharacterized protein n=1 Tax=Stephania cephalantha TaxID=152367 RepID=A0AAP0E850_9MAGN
MEFSIDVASMSPWPHQTSLISTDLILSSQGRDDRHGYVEPAVFCQCELLPMYVGRKVRPLSGSHSDGVAIKGKSTDDRSLIIKGSLPPFPLSNFVEVIGIADTNNSIQAEIMHLRTTGYANLRMGSTKAYFSRLVNGPFFKVAVKQYVPIHVPIHLSEHLHCDG